ncbi:hypothetical protein BU24DRAFT_457320 [Aaosphaeria arxii CBS 175.79]|uniref:Heterokaryon incompatibility domain-containing protein n=1 Tax=Aaosphaeria arxii CBS 175.79 TaxID=1450172 RepID=A0A6A5Y7R7_9PLEO|nr:uncharacterized protein BU24DRAFT_457320 [Aaosphaeria arxii CBS 175.79]KAF2021339.1 hypothetical protein BU24DRAFT_457320 [Aaosphaeria arxii CBS 175.79]
MSRSVDYPKSPAEAEKHIEAIRARLSGAHAEREDRLHKLISEQMYSKRGHFIYELLQNADDTEYAAGPIINIRHSGNRLLFECNEIGFSKADVEALCDASNSTKKKTNPTRKQIGEKGIGFKSVFKVCSSVWLKSGFYQFKFDKNILLGRIQPIWEAFPVSTTPGYTGILIDLEAENNAHIRSALEGVDPIILLFLQQVRQINISIHADGILARARGPTFNRLTAESIPKTARVLHRIRCERNRSGSSLVVFRYPVIDLPYHVSRPLQNDTEIILAFPESFGSRDKDNRGGVYAYLPVGKYGFKFYIQSDFIVTTSREKIDSNEWNRHLVDMLHTALIEAIKQLKNWDDSVLRYSWPLLIHFENAELDIFSSLPAKLEATLSQTAILEDSQGNFMLPGNLMHVPKEFMNTDGSPLIPQEHCARPPLNPKYPIESVGVLDIFQSLGVETQTTEGFLSDLRRFIADDPARFRTMPLMWYEQLCNALMILLKDYREDIAGLEIVPLSSGDWVSPSAGYCYFAPEQQDNLAFPLSVENVFVVHPGVMKNQSHAELLRAIGIKDGTPSELCKHIIKKHKEYSRTYTWWDSYQLLDKLKVLYSTKDMVSQMTFLYRSGWTPKRTKHNDVPDLWWIDESGEFCRTSDIYIQSSEPQSASLVSHGSKTRLRFLHPDYMKEFGDEPAGLEFLVKIVKVRKMLRVATSDDGIGCKLHNDFKSLAQERPIRMLQMLSKTWRFYGPWFTQSDRNKSGDAPSTLENSSKEELNKAVRDIMVPCHSKDRSIKIKLGEAYLPRKKLLELCETKTFERCGRRIERCSICITLCSLQSERGSQEIRGAVPVDRLLDVPDPDEDSWNFLDNFGVIHELTASVFVRHLHQIIGTNVSHAHMDNIYMHLESFIDGPDGRGIQKALQNSDAIYVPESVGASRGVWQGFYACDRKYLFAAKLTMRNATEQDLILEAMQLRDTDGIDHISSLLAHIPTFWVDSAHYSPTEIADPQKAWVSSMHQSFKSIPMIPVRLTGSRSDTFVLRSSDDDKSWFIPDRHHLHKAFVGLVDMAELSSLNSIQLKRLIEGLKMEERCLSKVATQNAFKAEQPEPLEKYTEALRKKVPYIHSAILSNYIFPDPAQLMSNVENIRAIGCEQIGNSWTLNSGEMVIESQPDHSQVSCRIEDNALVIYIAGGNDLEEALLTEPPPPEMSKGLLDFFGIEDKDDAVCLTQILAYNNLARLKKDLERWPRRRHPMKMKRKEVVRPESKNPASNKEDSGKKTNLAPENVDTAKDSANSPATKPNEMLDGQQEIPEALTASSTEEPAGLEIGLQASQSVAEKASSEASVGSGVDGDKTIAEGMVQEEPASQTLDEGVMGEVEPLNGDTKVVHHEINTERPEGEEKHDSSLGLISEQKFNAQWRDFPSNDTEQRTASTDSMENSISGKKPSPQRADFISSRDYDETLLSNRRYRKDAKRFVHMKSGRVHLVDPSPRMVFYGEDTKETRYLAELYMSRHFEGFFGKDIHGQNVYKPNEHWTSEFRLRNGHAPFLPQNQNEYVIHSTFTIVDTEGKLKDLMNADDAVDSLSLAEICSFHIEVCATSGGLHSPFILPSQQYEKAREMTTVGRQGSIENIYIIARVYNIHDDPGFALYADPWKLYLKRVISLEVNSSFEGSVSTATPAILSRDSLGKGLVTEIHDIYKDLYVGDQEIRLLELTLGNDNEHLQGELIVKDLRDPETSFWAISYVWGSDPNDQSPFFKTSKGKIRITDSLNECLRCLRRKRVKALIWADAICIDQGNNIEKNMQVRRMGTLYNTAEKVVIWTGGQRAEDLYAMDWLLSLRNLPRSSDITLDPATKIEHISEFLARAWFGRTWTIQELVFGSDVSIICHDQELGWDDFIAAISLCEEELLEKREALHRSGPALHLNKTRQLYLKEGRRYSLLQLLEMFHHTESSKPRDKLFAMLHMATDATDVKAFYPDYESTDNVILARYAKQYVASHDWLQLLYRAGSGKSSFFCTWIPDFMNFRRVEPYMPTISSWMVTGTGDGNHSFNAHPPGSRGVVVREPNSTDAAPILVLKGYVFDSIGDCRGLEITRYSLKFSDVLEASKRIANFGRYPDAGPDWEDDLRVKCLIGDAIGPYHKNSPQSSKQEVWAPEFKSTICGIRLDQDARKQMDEMSDASRRLVNAYLQTVSNFLGLIPGAALCTTKKGYIGIVPGETKPGDKVVLLFGSRVPFVVREGKEPGQYKLIGECYLHGIMHFQASRLSGLVEQEICLI